MSKEKKMAIAALCGLIVVLVAIGLLIPSCNADGCDADAHGNTGIEKKNDAATGAKDKEDEDVTAKSTVDSDAAKDPTSNESEESEKSNAAGSGSASQPSGVSSSSGSKPDPAPSKKWVPDYKKVWVEDSAAWDEQVLIYNELEMSICNVCGAEITDNEAPHAKTHALAGEGGGHHNDYRSILVGYETVHYEAVGHWETVESGGHWE